ncbi:unnamed protein product [Ranitomeya imitator]|uniref:MHC class I-like antigen recognition-like domain-containing protein n=1 Tax=Ranitomeya imitator TaxID=111125 RepID=A0ABN9KX38_9NEOB|nr:unnamed protein product [Ranitomeya imitator]
MFPQPCIINHIMSVVNSVVELPPVVVNGTSASSVYGLPLMAVSEAAASEVPCTDSHSLRYYYTGVSVPLPGIPEFSIIGYLDDQLIDMYSSDLKRLIPVAAWMKECEDPEYWERTTQVCKRNEALFRHEVKTVMKRFNHTEGLHIVQVMMSCELRDDGGGGSGHQQYRYDGREYMFFDTQTETYIPTMRGAEITTQRWNSLDVRINERAKNFPGEYLYQSPEEIH